jgi:hypothetical protein
MGLADGGTLMGPGTLRASKWGRDAEVIALGKSRTWAAGE